MNIRIQKSYSNIRTEYEYLNIRIFVDILIIYINFVELESPMLHAKFQDHRTSSSGEDFQRFLPYMGLVAVLIM